MREAINNGILITQFTDDFAQQYNYQVLEVPYNDIEYSDFDCQNGKFIFDIKKYEQRKQADYEVLVNWWNDYCGQRPLFIGQDIERTVQGVDPTDPNSHQMMTKYNLQRALPNIQGSCQWYAAACVNNPGNYRTVLEQVYHSTPALQPLMTFIDKKAPKKPKNVQVSKYAMTGTVVTWEAPRAKKELDLARQFVVYLFNKGEKIDGSKQSISNTCGNAGRR